MEHLKER